MQDLKTTNEPSKPAPKSGCCGGPAPEGAEACCARDADAKAAGQSGCGCETTTTKGCCG